jgi:hypothetical protein
MLNVFIITTHCSKRLNILFTLHAVAWVYLQNASRGDRILCVGSTAPFTVGQWYRVLQKDPGDGSLMWELNGGAFPVVAAQKGYADPCRWAGPCQPFVVC